MLDHLVLATPDLAATVAEFAARTGVTPAPGGSHTGLGTANALVGLSSPADRDLRRSGGDAYLEIVGPDPAQPTPPAPRPFGIDDLDAARLVTWAVHPPDLDATIARARDAHDDPGEAVPMSRRTPDGEQLWWRLTPARGPVPFLIDWGTTPHPTTRGLPEVALTSFTLVDPEPEPLRRRLAGLRVAATVQAGPTSALVAFLDTPRGAVTL